MISCVWDQRPLNSKEFDLSTEETGAQVGDFVVQNEGKLCPKCVLLFFKKICCLIYFVFFALSM